jgi:hypothetical protein
MIFKDNKVHYNMNGMTHYDPAMGLIIYDYYYYYDCYIDWITNLIRKLTNVSSVRHVVTWEMMTIGID